MCGGSPTPPPVPDPYAVAAAQFNTNLATLESGQAANQTNQITPTGALQYYQTGVGPNGIPTYTAVSQLSPAEQEMLHLQQQGGALAGGAGANILANTFGQYSQAPDLSNNAGGLTQQLLGQETSYLNPYFQNQTSQLDTQLRNQGIMPGTPAYNQQMQQVQDNQNRAVTGFLAQAEPAAFSQAQAQYQTPLQTAAGLASLNNPQGPMLTQTPQGAFAPTNVIQSVANSQNAAQQNYQDQLKQQNAMLSGLFGIGSAAINAFAPGLGSLGAAAVPNTTAMALGTLY
jgi:hypothetical protein